MILFFSEDIQYRFKKKTVLKAWIKNAIEEEFKKCGDINIILCSDKYLLDINKRFLNHDYYTDIITFNYNNEKINGDLYISLDRVTENAVKNKVPRETELYRVVIHGVLHLLGFNDKSEKEKEQIRKKEDYHLEKMMFHVEHV